MEYDSNSHSVTCRIKRTHDDKEPSVSVRAALTDNGGSVDITIDETVIQVADKFVKITGTKKSTLEISDDGITLTSPKIVLMGGTTTVTVDDNGADVT